MNRISMGRTRRVGLAPQRHHGNGRPDGREQTAPDVVVLEGHEGQAEADGGGAADEDDVLFGHALARVEGGGGAGREPGEDGEGGGQESSPESPDVDAPLPRTVSPPPAALFWPWPRSVVFPDDPLEDDPDPPPPLEDPPLVDVFCV